MSWRDFLSIILADWKLLFISPIASLFATVLILRHWTPEYTATMVIGPVSRIGAAAMGARAPLGVTAIPMTEYGNGEEALSDFTRFAELLTSPPVLQTLMNNDPTLLPKIFPEHWDDQTKQWRRPNNLTAILKQTALSIVRRQDWTTPDIETLSRSLKHTVIVSPVGTTSMRRIAYRHPDRTFALKLIANLTEAANQHLRQEAERRVSAQTQFIKNRLETVTQADHRRVLASLLADQERIALMIEIDLPLAADIIAPPSALSLPDWPNPLLLLPIAGVVGVGIGLLLIMIRFEPSARTPPQSSQALAPEPHECTPAQDCAPPSRSD
ncbi:Wzz domain-containing protein [Azospirillaceae bacterium]